MVGSDLQKFATEHGLTVENGVAYGEIEGYTMSFTDAAGSKRVRVNMFVEDGGQEERLTSAIADQKEIYAILSIEQDDEGLTFLFADTVGTMKRIEEFIHWLAEQLRLADAKGADYCVSCRMQLVSNAVYVQTLQGPSRMHRACWTRWQEQNKQPKSRGAILTLRGAIGAVLGGIIGSIPWMIAYYYGWFVGWLGFVIGWAANKGYSLLGGRPGKAKLVIVICAILFSVLFSFVASAAVTLVIMIADGELSFFQYGDIPMLLRLMITDASFWRDMLPDIGMGLVFAALGCWSMVKELRNESKGAVAPQELSRI